MIPAYFNRATLNLQSNNDTVAEQDFNKIIEIADNKALANLEIGRVYSNTPNFNRALPYLNKSIELQASPQAYLVRSIVYLLNKDLAKALTDNDKAVKLDPAFAPSYMQRGLLYYNTNNPTKALVDFNKTVELQANNPIAYWNRAFTQDKLGNKAAAKTDFTKAVALAPALAQSLPPEYK